MLVGIEPGSPKVTVMRNFLSGFLLGVFACSVVFLLRPAPEGPPGTPVEPPLATSAEGRIAPTAGRAPGDSPRESNAESPAERSARVSAEISSIDIPGAEAPPPAELRAAPTASGGSSPPAGTASSSYPPEIAEMIENRVDPALQRRYETDAREVSWATYMEGQLQAYFASKPVLQQFNFSLIDCRTSVCSVHALGYGPDALTQWNLATADIVTQPWHDFKSMSMNRQNPQPDVLGIVLILTREPP